MKIPMTYFLSHPIQYFSPLLRELAKKVNLKVYYFSDASVTGKKDIGFGQNIKWDIPLLDGYESSFVKNYSSVNSMNNRLFDVFNPGVIKILLRDPSKVVIVNGWSYSSTLICIIAGRLLGKRVWLRAESPLNQELKKNKIVVVLKKMLLKHFLFRFFIDKCLYIGTESKKFFEFYGLPPGKLVYTPYAVDNAFFSDQYYALKGSIIKIKSELNIPIEKKIILFSGKYISKKRPLDLLRAFHLLNENNYALIMVGEEALRQEMEEFIQAKNLQHVYLTGFINQSDISKYYAIADVFVMCSGMGETWGLSINEAMNFEKPIIVSTTCGSYCDLVKYGENGYSFDEGDIQELKICLEKTLGNDDFLKNAGKVSGALVKEFSIEKIVENLAAAVNDNKN